LVNSVQGGKVFINDSVYFGAASFDVVIALV